MVNAGTASYFALNLCCREERDRVQIQNKDCSVSAEQKPGQGQSDGYAPDNSVLSSVHVRDRGRGFIAFYSEVAVRVSPSKRLSILKHKCL